jgi:hypothetical protein
MSYFRQAIKSQRSGYVKSELKGSHAVGDYGDEREATKQLLKDIAQMLQLPLQFSVPFYTFDLMKEFDRKVTTESCTIIWNRIAEAEPIKRRSQRTS